MGVLPLSLGKSAPSHVKSSPWSTWDLAAEMWRMWEYSKEGLGGQRDRTGGGEGLRSCYHPQSWRDRERWLDWYGEPLDEGTLPSPGCLAVGRKVPRPFSRSCSYLLSRRPLRPSWFYPNSPWPSTTRTRDPWGPLILSIQDREGQKMDVDSRQAEGVQPRRSGNIWETEIKEWRMCL